MKGERKCRDRKEKKEELKMRDGEQLRGIKDEFVMATGLLCLGPHCKGRYVLQTFLTRRLCLSGFFF
jgi:hypothetical protein